MPASLVSQAVAETLLLQLLWRRSRRHLRVRNKLWQLEGAMRFGPQEIQQPGCCVVCINGEGAEFEVAAKLAAAGLRTLSDRAKLNSVPVFAIWTPYRNVYASILDLCNSVDELNAKIDQTKTELEAKIDQTKTELETKIDQTKTEFKTDIENMKQDIIAALAALRK
eukprot:s519_g26.t1